MGEVHFLGWGRRVLVADRQESRRQCIATVLQEHGCESAFAESGEEVLDALEARTFDLLILEGDLPAQDAAAVLKMQASINVHNGGRRPVPCSLVTTRDEAEAARLRASLDPAMQVLVVAAPHEEAVQRAVQQAIEFWMAPPRGGHDMRCY